MGRVVVLPSVVMVVAGLAGCESTARYVAKQGDTGVVAIPHNSDTWPNHYRRDAEELIRRHVGPDFEIVEEREVVTGVTTTNNQQVQKEKVAGALPFMPPAERDTINNTTTNRDVTEYQITYRRRAGGPATGFSPAGGAQPAGGAGLVGGVQPAGGVIPSVLPGGGPAAGMTPPAGRGTLPPGLPSTTAPFGGSTYR